DEIEDYVFVKRTDANTAMKEFLSSVDIRAHRTKVQLVEMSVPESIRSAVRKDRPDLLVIGTHGRSGLEKYFLGSIAEEILRTAEIDVLIVPPSSAARAS
ncbi:MAG: universal stress protein, partial [Sphingomonadaceae bacterium]